jgi:hypothetical protein
MSVGAALYPNEHYGLDLNYAYSDVYTSTNTCYQGVATVLPGGANVPAAATQNGQLCPTPGHGTTLFMGPAQDFMDAPTQFGSAAIMLSPNPKFRSNIGYNISSVNGSRLFSDARDVNGWLVSTYQSPFANIAYTLHPGLIWKAQYNFYGYGEGGQSGAPYCNKNTTIPSGGPIPAGSIVPCGTVPNTALSGPVWGFTAPRNFHANNITLGMHYAF